MNTPIVVAFVLCLLIGLAAAAKAKASFNLDKAVNTLSRNRILTKVLPPLITSISSSHFTAR